MKRVLYMPPMAIMAVGAGMSLAGGIAKGRAEQQQGEAEASYLRAQAEQEQAAKERDLTDFDRESSRAQARSRAVIAASGGGSEGSMDLMAYQAGVFGENRQRLINDSDARIRGLNVRAESAQSAGKAAMWASIFSGAGKGLSMGSSLFGGASSVAPAGGYDNVGSLISARGIR